MNDFMIISLKKFTAMGLNDCGSFHSDVCWLAWQSKIMRLTEIKQKLIRTGWFNPFWWGVDALFILTFAHIEDVSKCEKLSEQK